ncbi:GT4 family glycosyltransferase PelF [Arthrobacter sp. APC 3897]|uniref:GT4 family glycosyltransferase PelF n=1 Tax=Arthrobacter sp. APC 3897 TaxID=3035204 RepID=UPI0025B42CF5|nr:GT4 family glycosyltransferase PelF [Arthrobacter sp. APC 3897]MDN3483585.1 GT4 family glycosyltransferase PelF [Arthrobacter sp. APC 3897]
MYGIKQKLFRRAPLAQATAQATAGGAAVVLPAQAAAQAQYDDVDVAIVMESTYPYLKGGVSAVVHDIVTHNPDLTYGIIHITWDSNAPSEDLYGMPENVLWVRPVYLSMQEHRHDFMKVSAKDLGMDAGQRSALAHRLFDALYALSEDREVEPLWDLIDEGFNERTRTYPLWALLGTREFMEALAVRMPQLNLSLANSFWTLRNFLSLAFAILGETMPRASVYHAHTTGYASLLGAAAARDHGTSFLLTEHNLYVRDTVNTLLDRNMALSITSEDYRTFDVTHEQRAWMAWWTEMGHFCYPSASLITYLYPTAITEAAHLGTDIDKAVVVPNAMVIEEFEEKYRARLAAREQLVRNGDNHTWNLVYIARVVPIKGLLDLLSSIDVLRRDGFPNLHLDVLGPTEHVPEYYEACLAKIEALDLDDHITIHGTVNVRDRLDQFDLLVLPSYNEGQPIVVLEAMAAGIPTVGTDVGGMRQLISDELATNDGRMVGPCGELVPAGDVNTMAEKIRAVIGNMELYVDHADNARTRVEEFFQMHEIMSSYNGIYRAVGNITHVRQLDTAELDFLAPMVS